MFTCFYSGIRPVLDEQHKAHCVYNVVAVGMTSTLAEHEI